MKNTAPNSDALVTHFLVLPDGSVLAENLTPAMAAVLRQLDLRTDLNAQSSLRVHATGKTVVPQARAGDTQRTP